MSRQRSLEPACDMNSTDSSHNADDQGQFTRFADLPAEIRLQIWSYAVQLRNRLIQIEFNPVKAIWQACDDTCGGMPSIMRVCRDARHQALKPYQALFNTFVHLERDTILISDPAFIVRKARSICTNSINSSMVKRIALTHHNWTSLQDMNDAHPSLADSPACIVRKMASINRFAVVLVDSSSYEGHLFEHSDGLDEEDEGDEVSQDAEDEDDISSHTLGSPSMFVSEETEQDNSDERGLQYLESIVDNGPGAYFRPVGDSWFENPDLLPDFVGEGEDVYQDICEDFKEEKEHYPGWIRPMFTVVGLKYGLRPRGPGNGTTGMNHSLGDQPEAEDAGSEYEW